MVKERIIYSPKPKRPLSQNNGISSKALKIKPNPTANVAIKK